MRRTVLVFFSLSSSARRAAQLGSIFLAKGWGYFTGARKGKDGVSGTEKIAIPMPLAVFSKISDKSCQWR